MARPRIFISSTFYDLRYVRSDLDIFIESLGYDTVRNEEGDIPYGKEEALEEYCYKEIKAVDILISIIGGRYGSESRRSMSSISQMELKVAIKENKQTYIFIEKNVLSEYETYLINKENLNMRYKYVEDVRVYQFIEEVKSLSTNNNIKDFELASDISKYLKEQFAGSFQRFLAEQTRAKEVSLIRNLEKTAQTLNQLVNYLSDENKGKTDEINRILMINHPLTETLSTKLEIPYNFFIEGYSDMNKLLEARGFKDPLISKDVLEWTKKLSDKVIYLRISKVLFDDEKKLVFIKRTDWKDDFVQITEIENEMFDDLPF